MHRLAALLALAGLFAAPVQSRTQHVCRMSGEELAPCADGEESPSPVLVDDGCCERRQLTALAEMRAAAGPDPLALAPLLLAPIARAIAPPSFTLGARPERIELRACGPPRFVAHRALLL